MDLDELDCRIYLDAQQNLDTLSRIISDAVQGQVSEKGRSLTMRSNSALVEFRKNEEADPSRAAEFPDGFLYFRYFLEFYRNPSATQAEQVSLLNKILELSWAKGWAAVAACDYEASLLNRGGYNRRDVPWPAPRTSGSLPPRKDPIARPLVKLLILEEELKKVDLPADCVIRWARLWGYRQLHGGTSGRTNPDFSGRVSFVAIQAEQTIESPRYPTARFVRSKAS